MTLVKTTANLIATLAMSLCLMPAAWGQSPTKNSEQSPAPAHKSGHKKKAAAAPAATDAAPQEAAKPDAKTDAAMGKRDPFAPLVNDKKPNGPPLPPGKAGLVIATVHVDGTVKAANGMLAVVTNPDQRTYFLREGDRLYDGDVEKIGLDGVTFKENSKDAFGKPVERLVTKRIYPSAGEQQ
jgi:Tfp pilus assembly protein PilP